MKISWNSILFLYIRPFVFIRPKQRLNCFSQEIPAVNVFIVCSSAMNRHINRFQNKSHLIKTGIIEFTSINCTTHGFFVYNFVFHQYNVLIWQIGLKTYFIAYYNMYGCELYKSGSSTLTRLLSRLFAVNIRWA